MLNIGGINFESVAIIDGIQEDFIKIYGNQPETKQDGSTWYDTVGTAYTHTITLHRNPATSDATWDAACDVLANPSADVAVVIDHNQTTMDYMAHVSGGSRPLISRNGGRKYWGDITFTLTPISPQVRC